MWWGNTHWSEVVTNHWGVWRVTSDGYLIVVGIHLGLFWIFPYYFVTQTTQELADNDLGPSLFCHLVMNSLCVAALLAVAEPSQSKVTAKLPFSFRGLWSAARFRPLSSSAGDNALLFLWTPQPSVPLSCSIHTAASVLFPQREVRNHVWLLRSNLDFERLVWLCHQGAWIIHESVHSLING